MGGLAKRMPIVLLLVLLFSVVVLNGFWVARDTNEMLRTEQPKFITVRSFIDPGFSYEACSYFPPAYFWMCAKTTSLLKAPLSYDLCVFVNVLYLVLALVGMFLLGTYLTSSYGRGLAAALLLLALPAYLHFSRRFIGEFALTACVIWAVTFLISNPRWQDRGRALLFGLACGCGMLFKWTFVVFIMPPFLVSAGYACFDRTQDKRRVFSNIIISLLAALLVCGAWYFSRLDFTRVAYEYGANLGDWQVEYPSHQVFLKNNFALLARTLVTGVSGAFGLIVLLALAAGLRRSWRRADLVILLSWFVFPPLIFTLFIGEIVPRYLLPVFPALALIVVLLTFSKDKRRELLCLSLLALFSFGSIGYESFINRPPREYSPVKFDAVLQSLLEEEGSPRIVFNGINDEVTECEVQDLLNLFYVRDIEHRLGLDLAYVKTREELTANIGSRFVFSQALTENRPLHEYLKDEGYILFDRFSHHYYENTDPVHDWDCHGDYLLFRKGGP